MIKNGRPIIGTELPSARSEEALPTKPVKGRSLDSNVERDGSYFRRAIEPRVDADCSYPASRINLSLSNAIQTHVVDLAHWRENEGTNARESDLASVTVA